MCCVSSETAFFVLKCDKDAITLYLEQGLNEEDGCEAAFEPIYEVINEFYVGTVHGQNCSFLDPE